MNLKRIDKRTERHKGISVIIPVYNSEQYLRRCINSVLMQNTNCITEIILVNDGSTDDSGKICDEYSQANSLVNVFHAEHGGSSFARNIGLDNASGEFVYFLDSDDYIGVDTISILINVAQKEDADITDGTMLLEFANGEKKPFYTEHGYGVFDHEAYLREMLSRNIIGWENAGKLYRSDVIGNVRFDENHIVAEDLLFNWHVADNVKKYCYAPQAVYYYVQNNGSSMHSGISQGVLDSLKVYQSIADDAYKREMFWAGDIVASTLMSYGLSLIQKMLVDEKYEEQNIHEVQKLLIDCRDLYGEKSHNNIFREALDPNGVVDLYSIPETKTRIDGIKNAEKKRIRDYFVRFDKVYLFGGGEIAKIYLDLCNKLQLRPTGVIVSERGNVLDEIKARYDVVRFESIADELEKNVGIVVAAGNAATIEIEELLRKNGFLHYLKSDRMFTNLFLD